MYVLHYVPDNASLIVRLALEEAGLPYEARLVDRRARQHEGEDFRRLNPAGLIPALETPEGPLSETGAILLWLADRHPEARLAPPVHAPDRGEFLRWLFFLSNTAHADLRQLFYPDQYVPQASIAGHHAILATRMRRHFTLLNAAAASHPALFAPPSALMLYTAALMRWAVLYPRGQARWFRASDQLSLAAAAMALEERPAALAVAAAEGLGEAPFTRPTEPRPPEGPAF